MDSEPQPVGDDIQEVLCKLDSQVLARYQQMKREMEQRRKDTTNRFRTEVGKLLKWKRPPLDRIEDLQERAKEEVQRIEDAFQTNLKELLRGLLKKDVG